jgi:hypothetical protein
LELIKNKTIPQQPFEQAGINGFSFSHPVFVKPKIKRLRTSSHYKRFQNKFKKASYIALVATELMLLTYQKSETEFPTSKIDT